MRERRGRCSVFNVFSAAPAGADSCGSAARCGGTFAGIRASGKFNLSIFNPPFFLSFARAAREIFSLSFPFSPIFQHHTTLQIHLLTYSHLHIHTPFPPPSFPPCHPPHVCVCVCVCDVCDVCVMCVCVCVMRAMCVMCVSTPYYSHSHLRVHTSTSAPTTHDRPPDPYHPPHVCDVCVCVRVHVHIHTSTPTYSHPIHTLFTPYSHPFHTYSHH